MAEALVKQLTGNDKLCARFMRVEFFEFRREFKTFLDTNHKPQIRGTDRGIWDRIKLIPFIVEIPEDKQIPKEKLMSEFRKEYPGILNWLLQGCLEWQEHGLPEPDDVLVATKSYQREMDMLEQFIEEECRVAHNNHLPLKRRYRVPYKELYNAYLEWCKGNGEQQLSKRDFKTAMLERGFEQPQRFGNGGNLHWFDIRLFDHAIDMEDEKMDEDKKVEISEIVEGIKCSRNNIQKMKKMKKRKDHLRLAK